MSSHNTRTLLKFVTKHLDLSVAELLELRDALNAHLCERVGIAPVVTTTRRTLYLPDESMRSL